MNNICALVSDCRKMLNLSILPHGAATLIQPNFIYHKSFSERIVSHYK